LPALLFLPPFPSGRIDYEKDQWDLIVLSYAWGPFQDPAHISKIETSLRERGLLVWEQYGDDGSRSSNGSPRMLNSVPKMFDSFRILRYEYAMARPDWNPEGPVEQITRLVAQKM